LLARFGPSFREPLYRQRPVSVIGFAAVKPSFSNFRCCPKSPFVDGLLLGFCANFIDSARKIESRGDQIVVNPVEYIGTGSEGFG
jgi:hypothetical protein